MVYNTLNTRIKMITSRRLTKQLIYGSAYFLMLLLAVFWIYSSFSPEPNCFDGRKNQGEEDVDCGGPCPSCEIKYLRPLEVSNVKYFASDGTLSLGAQVKNPNTRFGARSFKYEFAVYGESGKKVASVTGVSFIYPSEVKYLIASVEVDLRQAAVDLKLENFEWEELSKFSPPKIDKREIRTELLNGRIEVSGVLVSGETTLIKKAAVGGVLFGKSGEILGFSKTTISDFRGFEERFFKLTFPKGIASGAVEPSLTRIFVEAKRE